MNPWRIASDAAADSSYALRSFRRSLGWTCVTLLTIALGVGASTAVFSVAETFLVRPLAYRDASRVYAVSLQGKLPSETISLPLPATVVEEWRTNARTIESAAAYGGQPSAILRGDSDDVSVTTAIVDTSFLAFTGAHPVIGRSFTGDEAAPDGPGAIMISEGFWRRQFGASPDVLGKVVRLEVGGSPASRLSTIVGVMPAAVFLPDFKFERSDVWLPLPEDPNGKVSGVAVRLKPGATPAAASNELTAIFDRAGAIDPEDRPLQPRIRLSRPQDDLPFRQALILLTGAVILLLLIACSNVAHLLLQRGLSRQRELAIRQALGAHRARLIRQLVTESGLLGLAGGAFAVLVAWASLRALAQLRPASLPALSYLSATNGVLPIAAVLAITVGLAVGLLGALHVAQDLAQPLRTGTATPQPAHRRVRGTLVIGQIALSTVLLVGAILLIGVVVDLSHVRLGFDPHDLYGVSFRSRDVNTPQSPESLATLATAVRDLADGQLGSRDATIAANATTGSAFESAIETREHPGTVISSGFVGINFVAPDYFSVMRMPLVAGRPFDEGSLGRNEVVVSRTLAQRLGSEGTVVGRQFRFRANAVGQAEPWQTVVGIVPDILTNRLDRVAQPMLFRPFPGTASGATLIVRLHGGGAEGLLRRFARSVQPDPLTWRVTNVDKQVEQAIAEPRFTMFVLVLFAASGVLLGAIGLFGVLSYTLGLRTRDISVRITLGATRRHISGLVIREAMGQAGLGIVVGMAGAVGAERILRTSFYGVTSLGMVTFLLAGATMLLISLAACATPLWRAMSVDAAIAMRAE